MKPVFKYLEGLKTTFNSSHINTGEVIINGQKLRRVMSMEKEQPQEEEKEKEKQIS